MKEKVEILSASDLKPIFDELDAMRTSASALSENCQPIFQGKHYLTDSTRSASFCRILQWMLKAKNPENHWFSGFFCELLSYVVVPLEPEFMNEHERVWMLHWCKLLDNSAIWILRKIRLFTFIQKTWWPAWWPDLTNRGLSCYICRTKVADCEQSWTPRPNFLQHLNYGNNSLREKINPVSCPT